MRSALLRLREAQDSMSSTERGIAQYIRAHAEEVPHLSIRQLAERTFSSPSSILRVCRAVGFSGYREFSAALMLEVAAFGHEPLHREADILPDDTVSALIDKITGQNIQSLEDTRRLLSAETVSHCVTLLRSCKTVLLFGIGSSLCVAKDVYLKFLRLNKPCVVNEDWHSQLLQARNATPQDVGIVFSYSGQTLEMIDCMKEMRRNHTPIIAVTRYSPSPVAQGSDYQLYTAANESLFRNGAMSSRLAQLNVVDILYTAFANTERQYCLEQLTRTHISKPGDPPVDPV